jgi:hypothetical protein
VATHTRSERSVSTAIILACFLQVYDEMAGMSLSLQATVMLGRSRPRYRQAASLPVGRVKLPRVGSIRQFEERALAPDFTR